MGRQMIQRKKRNQFDKIHSIIADESAENWENCRLRYGKIGCWWGCHEVRSGIKEAFYMQTLDFLDFKLTIIKKIETMFHGC